uniref:Trypanosoma vivax n=1 Tax=Trypanosoma vivax (strain Y486) TaxID=1055687 RepID=G0U636_TRYVY|nr:Trypanosoma vivax [Trypanosoma vivax Y486]
MHLLHMLDKTAGVPPPFPPTSFPRFPKQLSTTCVFPPLVMGGGGGKGTLRGSDATLGCWMPVARKYVKDSYLSHHLSTLSWSVTGWLNRRSLFVDVHYCTILYWRHIGALSPPRVSWKW